MIVYHMITNDRIKTHIITNIIVCIKILYFNKNKSKKYILRGQRNAIYYYQEKILSNKKKSYNIT